MKRLLVLLVVSLALLVPLLHVPCARATATGDGGWVSLPTDATDPASLRSGFDPLALIVLQQAALSASDAASNDFSGTTVALSGDTALVAAPGKDAGGQYDVGAVYVFTRSGTTWSQQAKLTVPVPVQNDNFGSSLAVSGDTALVGVMNKAVYVFTRSGTSWSLQAELTASEATQNDQFGSRVALSGDTALVSAPQKTVGGVFATGAVYVFTRSGTSWIQQAELSASDPAQAWFGQSIALSGNTALIGVPAAMVMGQFNAGAAYVFTRSGTSWSQRAKLNDPAPASNDEFGWSVALSGGTALVCALGKDVGGTTNAGATYVFTGSGASWSQQAELTASDPAPGGFGGPLALSGDTAVVGAPHRTVGGQAHVGAAYIFTRSGTSWIQRAELSDPDAAEADSFGNAVALSGNTALVGAPNVTVGSLKQAGAAYVYVYYAAPTVTIGGADTAWRRSGVDLAVTTTVDPARSLASLHYSTNGGLTWSDVPGSGSVRTLPISAEGTTTVTVRVTDSAADTASAEATVRIDTAPPLTRDDADDAWHASNVTVHFESADSTSGVAGTKYRIDGGSWTEGTEATVPAPADHSFDGAHRIDYRSTDVAGNVESVRSCTVRIDTTPPTTSDSADGAWHNAAYTLVLTASDAHSGVQKTDYRVDGGAWQSGDAPLIDAEGSHLVTYRSTDNAGNVESTRSCQVKIDTVAPETTQSGADDAWHQSPVTVSFAASDATSGVQRTQYRLDAGRWTTGTQVTVAADGDHILRYRSQDKAGNVEKAKTCRVRIDRTPPVSTQTGADGRWHNLAVTVVFAASDRVSGVASTSFSTDGGVTWQTGASLVVDAPATHANDGTHAILYRSTDNAGLVEVPRRCTVRIDTRRPVTAAPYRAKVKRGSGATLRYRVGDQQPCAGKATVTIKVTTLGGRVVKVLKLGQRRVNHLMSYQFRCTLAKRTYKFRVYATDAAGNKQAVAGWNRLTVR